MTYSLVHFGIKQNIDKTYSKLHNLDPSQVVEGKNVLLKNNDRGYGRTKI